MKKYIITLLTVLAVLLFVYQDFIIGGMERTSQDAIKQGMPINQFVETEKTGAFDYPLWYNDIFCGMPFHASGTYHIKLNIETFVRTIMPDSLFTALDGRFTLHLLLGFVFMVILMRYAFKLEYIPSVAAGFAFILTSHILGTEHVNRISTFIYVPMVFLGAKLIFDKDYKLGSLILALGLGFQLNSYHQQITYYTMLFIGFYFLWKIIFEYKDNKVVEKRSIALFIGALTVGILIGLVAIWPLHDYLPYSARGAGMSGDQKYQWMTNWCFSPKSVLDFIFPYFEGFAVRTPVNVNGTVQSLQTYWGSMPFTDYPHYLGVIVVVLAGFGLMGIKKNRELQFIVASSLVFLFLSFGRDLPVLYNLFYNIVPYFDKFRAPSLMLIILEFNVVMLAGIGLNNIITKFETEEVFNLSKKMVIAVSIFFVITLVLTSPIKSFMFDLYNASGKGQEKLNVFRYNLLQMDFFRLIILVSLFHLAIWFGKVKSASLKNLVPILITLLLIVDLLIIGKNLVHGQYKKGTSEDYYVRAKTNTVKFLLEDKSKYRIFPVDEFTENRFGYWRIETIGGYHAAKTAYIQKIMDNKLLFNRGVLNMLNVKYILSKQDLRGMEAFSDLALVKQFGDKNVFQNTRDYGRVFFAGSFSEVTSDDQALSILAKSDFDPIKNLFLQDEVKGKLTDLSNNAKANIVKYSSNEIDVDVDAQTNTIMVLSEVYYPVGWNVYVDGEKKDINRTNYILRSLFLEKGKHKVVMKFEPASFKISIMVSLFLVITLSIIFVVFVVNKFYFQGRKNLIHEKG